MTTTKYESARLLLELFELRREAKLREARDWFFNFKPKSAQDIMDVFKSPDSAKFRMVLSYWEQAAVLVNHGAIDVAMFEESSGECLIAFAKVEPFLHDLRKGMPTFCVGLEKAVHAMPNSKPSLEYIRKTFM